jgi:dephospho-CoA kinase
MKRVALTGGIATGKSHVRARFESLGVPTTDADVLAREAVAPGSAGLDTIIKVFGADVLDAGGALDRGKMAARVFFDPGARRALEQIVHPIVRESMRRWFDGLPASTPVAIADIPLLYETGREGEFDAVIVTACVPDEQMRRLAARGLSENDARARLDAQIPVAEKAARADYVIDTNGSIADTDRQVESLLGKLVGRQ